MLQYEYMPRKSAHKKRKRIASKGKKSLVARLKNAIPVVMALIVSGSFLLGYGLYKNITQELASAFTASDYDIKTESLYTVVYLGIDDFTSSNIMIKKLNYLILDKSTSKVVIYKIPLDMEIDCPGKFGSEPIKNIFSLGRFAGEGSTEKGMELINKSILKLFAFPVDRYIMADEKGAELMEPLLLGKINIGDTISQLDVIRDRISTNFSLRELFDLYSFTASLPKDRLFKKEVTPGYLENTLLLDEELRDLTFDLALSNEKKSIAVLNGSGVPGIAGFGSRIVQNYGGRVVAVGNSSRTYEKSVLIVDDMDSESTRIIRNLFDLNEVIVVSQAGDYPENEINRSDITLIIGLDIAHSL